MDVDFLINSFESFLLPICHKSAPTGRHNPTGNHRQHRFQDVESRPPEVKDFMVFLFLHGEIEYVVGVALLGAGGKCPHRDLELSHDKRLSDLALSISSEEANVEVRFAIQKTRMTDCESVRAFGG
jgi:hypothetical protein